MSIKTNCSEPNNTPDQAQTPAAAPPSQKAQSPKREPSSWIGWFVRPLLLFTAGILLIVCLGIAQRTGWITAEGSSGGGESHTASAASNVRYICPMMCTPPQSEPGRCPVCAMELVPAAATNGNGDRRSIEVDSVARRVAGIQTVAVKSIPLTRKIRTLGEISYDEGKMTNISAYVNGRLDRLYADYTGVVVKQGDHLALLYSPEIYTAQVEFLLSRKMFLRSQQSTSNRSTTPQGDFHYGSSREKLLELGLTEEQIQQLEQSQKAHSRIHLCAPSSGTVIEKMAVEGQYVKTGQTIYRLADLSTVWLMLELFPEDAAAMRYGQKVIAEVQSLPGKKFTGRVEFIDPVVDKKTRTVGVRVVYSNEKGLLRIGDYAKASIEVALNSAGDPLAKIYDPELAGKWIGPRHPHIVESSPGKCRECGVDLVPAEQFGFVSEPTQHRSGSLVVPRNAVLMAGGTSVVYVETAPGRFEIRKVVLGHCSSDQAVILKGVQAGEQVAVKGNFLLDSQMQLAGNPSLIDPTKLLASTKPSADEEKASKTEAALAGLSPEDRLLAQQQGICPVTKLPLGSMGPPAKVDLNGLPIFICCLGCKQKLLEDPAKYLANLMETEAAPAAQDDEAEQTAEAEAIAQALAELSPEDRRLAAAQKICPVSGLALGSMGAPPKVEVNGRIVFLCCEGCRASLLAEPIKYFAKLPQEAVR